MNQQTNSETIGFDPGASSHDRHGVLGGKQDTVDSPHGFHGREPDRIITENIEDQESTELINEGTDHFRIIILPANRIRMIYRNHVLLSI